jgi:hypothetical protein
VKALNTISTLFFVFILIQVDAQISVNSPYTRFGIGFTDLSFNPRAAALGGTGVSLASDFNLQLSNPASYAFMKETTFQGSVYSKQTSLQNGNQNQKYWGGQVGEMGFGFKRTQSKWGFAMGLRPESQVGYKFENAQAINDSTNATYSYSGEGGFSNFSVGLSRMFLFHVDSTKTKTHSISVGANLNYRFGSILRVDRVNFNNSTIYNSKVTDRLVVKDANPSVGIIYNFPLHVVQDKGKALRSTHGTLAGTFEIQNDFSVSNQEISQLTRNVNGVEVTSATILDTTYTGLVFQMPMKIEFGANIRHEFKKNGAVLISTSYRIQDWTGLANEVIQVSNQQFYKSTHMGIGLEYQPNTNGVSDQILSLGIYRIGAFKQDLYFGINEEQLQMRAVSCGFQLPFPASKTSSSICLSAEFGQVGQVGSTISENYASFQVGFVMRPFEKWFLRRKYD